MNERLYQPSSGMEGMDFMEVFCFRCKRDAAYQLYAAGRGPEAEGCDILSRTMLYSPYKLEERDKYPKEWNYGPDGPRCTAFEPDGAAR